MIPLAAPPADLAAVCASGEAAARRCVLSKVDRSLVRSLDIVVSAEKGKGKGKGKDFSVDVSIDLDPVVDIDIEALADEAAEAALSEIDLKMKGQKA
ncbi:MAG TPA: DUF3194 domain-containing protein [Candidatus Methanomethylicus sp.]|nr:DUF3194 domain-containing protein [Candidatus Methanomethylicus sp.]